jgi:uncharacterized protein YdaU (DUF1376 family)
MPAKHETWMPLYIADYLGDTLHLTTEQHGAYLLLLMAAWKRGGHVPDDEAQLAQITRLADRWQTHASATVRAFFAQRDGMLWHDRVVDEIHKAEALVHKRSRAGAAGAAAKWHNDGKRTPLPLAAPMPPECVDDGPSPSPSPSKNNPPSPRKRGADAGRFEEFWLAWPKGERKQDKAKCLDHWMRNQLDQHADAILADVRTKRGTRKWAEGFIEAPLVYLRGKRWLDGVVPESADGGTEALDWRSSWPGIVAKGVELGLGAWSEELQVAGKAPDFPEYKRRVFAKVRELESGPADEAGQKAVADLIGGVMKRVA